MLRYSPDFTLQSPRPLHALRDSALLASHPEEPFDSLTNLAAKILHLPVALITLVDEEQQFLASDPGRSEPRRIRGYRSRTAGLDTQGDRAAYGS